MTSAMYFGSKRCSRTVERTISLRYPAMGMVSCYDDDSLRFIRLETGALSMGPSFLAEADSTTASRRWTGWPLLMEPIWWSLQRLGRADGYRPTSPAF